MDEEHMTEYITLGSTDLRISPLGMGTWQWGDNMVWGYSQGSYTDSDLQAAFQDSLKAGVNFFDTAEMYGWGRSETLLGQSVRAAADQPVVVATKFMPLPWRLRKASLQQALSRSLNRLGLEKVDLYQIHFPTPPVPIETWVDALADVVQLGLARAVGVSNYTTDQMRRAHAVLAKRGVPLASNQVRYNLLDRTPERTGLLQACRELNVTLIAYSPLAQGLLTGKYTPQNLPPGIRRFRSRSNLVKVQPLVALLREIGQAHGGKTPSQVSLNWLMCKGAAPIPGAKNARQVQDNVGALGWRLTDSEMAALDAV
jgi:aryl-alcohol dehydrogenase-like predicted oxidoreductase